MNDQLYIQMKNFLNELLFKLLEAWHKELDNWGSIGTILMDLSKAYDYLPHDLLIAKLGAYVLDRSSLRLLMDYLNSRKQQRKVGSSYTEFRIVPYLLFNIFINDLCFFIEKSDICNFADDNTLYSCGANLKTVLENLKHDASKLLYWFKINSMKANPEKFQFMILSKKSYQPQKLSVNTFTIDESDEVELLGLTIDKELNFSKHIDKLCRNAQYKLHALRRIRKYLSLEKAKMLGNAFIDSQFNYAPLIWMFCRKGLYLKMQKIHHKTLKVIYQSNKTY